MTKNRPKKVKTPPKIYLAIKSIKFSSFNAYSANVSLFFFYPVTTSSTGSSSLAAKDKKSASTTFSFCINSSKKTIYLCIFISVKITSAW